MQELFKSLLAADAPAFAAITVEDLDHNEDDFTAQQVRQLKTKRLLCIGQLAKDAASLERTEASHAQLREPPQPSASHEGISIKINDKLVAMEIATCSELFRGRKCINPVATSSDGFEAPSKALFALGSLNKLEKLFIHVDSATKAVVEWSEDGKYDSRCTRSSVETAVEINAVYAGVGAAHGGMSFETITAAGNSNGEFKSCAKVFVRECSFHLINAYDPHQLERSSTFILSEEFLKDAQLLADKEIVTRHDISSFCDKYGNVVLTEVDIGLMAVSEQTVTSKSHEEVKNALAIWKVAVSSIIGGGASAQLAHGGGSTTGGLTRTGHLSWTVIGGNGATVSNDNVGSIINFRGKPSAWRVVDYKKPKSIMSFLPSHLLEHCRTKFGHLIAFEYHYPDGGVYEGTFKKATTMREGVGKMTYSNGDSYCGQWEDDKRHGRGKMVAHDGIVKDGLWFHDYFSPIVVFDVKFKHGLYTGGWKGNAPNGGGICRWFENFVYKGGWSDGKMTGNGVFTWSTGSTYSGTFVANKRSGRGVLNYSDGHKYDGDWKDNNKHGHGELTLPNGVVCTGTWVDDSCVHCTYPTASGALLIMDERQLLALNYRWFWEDAVGRMDFALGALPDWLK